MILKFINGRNDKSADLKTILDYVSSDNKTTPDLMGGYCCDTKYPYTDMLLTKKLHSKTDGKQYEHYVVSFDPDDDIDVNAAFEIIGDIAAYFDLFQSFWALHTDTAHLHAHIVVNSVCCKGEKFRQWKPQLNSFKDHVDGICYKHGIKPILRACTKRPVDDVNMLEFTDDEYKYYVGGTTMNTQMNNDYGYNYPHDSYSEPDTYEDEYYEDNDSYYPAVSPSVKTVRQQGVITPQTAPFYPNRSGDLSCEGTSQQVTSNRKNIFFGDRVNIAASSEEEAIHFIQTYKSRNRFSFDEVKYLTNEFGANVDIHFENQFNVILFDKDSLYAPDHIDTSV